MRTALTIKIALILLFLPQVTLARGSPISSGGTGFSRGVSSRSSGFSRGVSSRFTGSSTTRRPTRSYSAPTRSTRSAPTTSRSSATRVPSRSVPTTRSGSGYARPGYSRTTPTRSGSYGSRSQSTTTSRPTYIYPRRTGTTYRGSTTYRGGTTYRGRPLPTRTAPSPRSSGTSSESRYRTPTRGEPLGRTTQGGGRTLSGRSTGSRTYGTRSAATRGERTLRPVSPRSGAGRTPGSYGRSGSFGRTGVSTTVRPRGTSVDTRRSHGFRRGATSVRSYRPPRSRGYYTSHSQGFYRHVRDCAPRYSYSRNRHCSSSGIYLGLSWPWYYGYSCTSVSYGYHPWYTCWPTAVTVAYVPYGFYVARPVVLVREVEVVRDVVIREPRIVDGDVVIEEVPVPGESEEDPNGEAAPEEGAPPVLDPTTEKYLRDGSDAFVKADYVAAAEAFRMAVVSRPDVAAPRFAYGQALIALGDYPYASRVLRVALAREPEILNAPGSIAGVYKDAEEFARVVEALAAALAEAPDDPDLLFLLAYEQHFSGDPSAKTTVERLRAAWPDDPMVALLAPAVTKRFAALDEFPPSKKVEPK